MKLIVCLVVIASIGSGIAQELSPKPLENETLSLWDFNTNSNEFVVDLAENPLGGEIFGASREAIPEAPVEFEGAIKISQENQFVDFGVTRGSKLDFKGTEVLSVESVIRLNASAPDTHIIFSNDQVQLMVIGNKLGGFVRLPGGFRGVVSDEQLALNTNYRVTMLKVGDTVAIAINDKVVNSVVLEGDIVDTSYPDARITIGGNIFGQYFPGYIDDVRVSGGSVLDIVKPEVSIIQPDSFVVNNGLPYFNISLSDNDSGIDSSSIKVYLNSNIQNGLTINENSIVGYMDEEFKGTILNEVRVVVRDNAGNLCDETFKFSFTQIGSAVEYQNDANTLGLWHMDDFGLAVMSDSSSWGNHGYGEPKYLGVGDGVFGKARFFQGSSQSFMTISSIQIPEKQLTFETWVNPSANSNYEEIIFESGEIKVARFDGGQVRVVFNETQGLQVFESEQELLPVGELVHLAVTWDGSKDTNNLNLFINGGIAKSFDACISCDLNPVPQIGIVGKHFNGMLDEMRLSSTVRTSFNVPNNSSRNIEFLNLKDGVSTNIEFPEIHIKLNSESGIDPQNIKLKLNGRLQSPGTDLVITDNSIDGIFNDSALLGVNYVEVDFIDNDGVQKKKTEYFFRILKRPIGENTASASTVALYHFDRFKELKDASGNNYDLNGTISTAGGVVGEGATGASVSTSGVLIGSRAFTLEGHFKVVEEFGNMSRILYLYGDEFNFSLYVNSTSLDINLNLTTPEMSVNKTLQGVFPDDGAYHHLALVYDSARSHGQVLLLIDGKVRQVITLENPCDLNSELNFSIGARYFEYDEVRLSNQAIYDFKISEGISTPVIDTQEFVDGMTIWQDTQEVVFTLGSEVGISSEGSEVYLNNNLVTNLSLSQSGTNAEFSGVLSGFVPGANTLEVYAQDMDGVQSKLTMLFYFFKSGGKTAYTSDENTYLLLHFNEVETEQFVDSSSYAHQIDVANGWGFGKEGVFEQAGSSNNTYSTGTVGSLEGLSTYTIEMWKQDSYSNLRAKLFEFGFKFEQVTSTSLAGIQFKTPKNQTFTINEVLPSDGLFHHYALVVDSNHPLRQVYILKDGKVLGSSDQFSPEDLSLTSEDTVRFGNSFYNDSIDELRFSKQARYELNF